jgi:hypothetical protein
VASGISGHAVYCQSCDEWGAVNPIVIGFLVSLLACEFVRITARGATARR